MALPLPLRAALLGAATLGLVGGLIGLLLGLDAYPPTTWFAVIEIGLPAAILGALIGAAAGSIAWTYRRVRRGRALPHRQDGRRTPIRVCRCPAVDC
ncbi:hypothetical protein E8D34_20345 [Nocardioides sp. GY 10113]|uniref:hypothetical protein n=1 Tax=Nocardioides sp. GY 10113 TaxID=2569761 RepID=UPI0010A7AF94|nr:hypothetical protein [Nocardioides sp. GY 10113]TIC79526.1 hypothetical protein E8D34_20345 [Nocardioides sp. GY 10113]